MRPILRDRRWTHYAIVRALLAVALTVASIALAACGGADEAGGPTAAQDAEASSPPATEGDEAILIKTHVNIPNGEVLDGSSIGVSPFCPGGTFHDQHGNDDIGLVDRTFRCPDGTLRIGFTPGVPQGRTQTGPWKVLSGSGAFEGLQGSGQMEMKYERGSDTKGRETFTGSVAR